jgi:hypothetical protein
MLKIRFRSAGRADEVVWVPGENIILTDHLRSQSGGDFAFLQNAMWWASGQPFPEVAIDGVIVSFPSGVTVGPCSRLRILGDTLHDGDTVLAQFHGRSWRAAADKQEYERIIISPAE